MILAIQILTQNIILSQARLDNAADHHYDCNFHCIEFFTKHVEEVTIQQLGDRIFQTLVFVARKTTDTHFNFIRHFSCA